MPKQGRGCEAFCHPNPRMCRHSQKQGVTVGNHISDSLGGFPIDGHGRRFTGPRQRRGGGSSPTDAALRCEVLCVKPASRGQTYPLFFNTFAAEPTRRRGLWGCD